MHCNIGLVELLLALTAGLTHASHYRRDESSEDTNTEFNLASTFKGGISSNRHHARAQLNSQLYPDLRQQPSSSDDIDAPSAHESGGSGVGTLDVRPSPYGVGVPPIGYPNNPVLPVVGRSQPAYQAGVRLPYSSPAACGRREPGSSPNSVPNACQPPNLGHVPPPFGYPPGLSTSHALATNQLGGNPAGAYPNFGPQLPFAYQPGHPINPYPGQYLPQYPSYPQTAPYPLYPNYGPGAPGTAGLPGSVPVVTHPEAPPTSYQNQHIFAAQARPGPHHHYDRSFKVKTEYTEDGVHKGPFDVLNNHGSQGYGSGFGGGYNGAFARPGY